MLAYLFLHEAAAGVIGDEYEAGLRRFHAALADAGVPGFVASRTYRVRDGYCDWYLIEGSAALARLHEAAVTGKRSQLHDAVARQAVNGVGKLLRLVAGGVDAGAIFEIGFAKPRGVSEAELYGWLKPWTERAEISLWRRVLALGPPPEFVLLSRSAPALPDELNPEVLRREPVWD